MTTVTFDTLKYVEALRAAGVPEFQAKAMAEAQSKRWARRPALTLATKADIMISRASMRLMKWMLGFLLALGVVQTSGRLIRLARRRACVDDRQHPAPRRPGPVFCS